MIILHILWLFSAKLYYTTTYKKYIETQSDFNWSFLFKNKKLPYTEKYYIILYDQKIGEITRLYDRFSKGYRITTTATLSMTQPQPFPFISEYNHIEISLTVIFNPLFDVSDIKTTVNGVKNCPSAKSRCKPENLATLEGKRVKDKLEIDFFSKLLPIKKYIYFEIPRDALNNSLGQNLIFFGSRPAVGKSWIVKLGTFSPITATVEEKFERKTKEGNKVTIFSITYSSPHVSGYAWVDENGELLKINLYKPPLLIRKKDIDF